MRDAKGIESRLGAMLAEYATPAADGIVAVRAPARSEIAGNHTDHEGGRVIAGALDRSIEALAVTNGKDAVRVFSSGYTPVEVRLDDLDARTDEQVSSNALVRGMAAQMVATGRETSGFDLVMTSDIPSGGGLSSSAAYELALCRAMEALWPGRAISAVEAAQMAQRVERDWFGKPCGLMDQLAVSLGGLSYMGFREDEPVVESLAFDFREHGYDLVLTDVGCDHSAYTDEYAAVPTDMHAVAQALGHERLCEVSEQELLSHVRELRASLGDRAVLRALHYYQEMMLVDPRWDALQRGDIGRFLFLTRTSGASSGMFQQNVSVGGSQTQDCMVAIALSERLLRGCGATRIHGGGFGGSIQAFVPTTMTEGYVTKMNALLGEGAAKTYTISQEGAQAQWL